MGQPYLQSVQCILIKIEPTSGVDAVPDHTNAIRTSGFATIKPATLGDGDRSDEQTGTMLIAERALSVGKYATITLTTELKGAGAAYSSSVAGESDPLFRVCGMERTITTTTGAEHILYSTLDGGVETASVYIYQYGMVYRVLGCVGTAVLTGEANKRVFLKTTLTGLVSGIANASIPASLVYSAVIPPLFANGATAIGSYNEGSASPLVLRKVELTFGNDIKDRPSAGATDGLVGYAIVGRKPTLTATIEIPAISAWYAYAYESIFGGSQLASPLASWEMNDPASDYNSVTVHTGGWQIKWPEPSAQNAIGVFNLTGKLGAGASVSGRDFEIDFIR